MIEAAVSVVVPAFNEEARLPRTLDRLLDDLDAHLAEWEVIVADDGSSDGTAAVVEARCLEEPRLRLVRASRNEGKGAALRRGAEMSKLPLIAFLDADLPVPPSDLAAMAALTADADLVVGSRRLPGSVITTPQPLGRRVGGRAFLSVVNLLGYTSVSDPQCGVKVLRADRVSGLLRQVSSSGFGFDIELIERTRRAGCRVVEHPVEWTHVDGSSLRPMRDAVTTLTELARLRRRIEDPARARAATGPATASSSVPADNAQQTLTP